MMKIDKAVVAMEADKLVKYQGQSWYILFLDRIHGICTLSNHVAGYQGTMITKPDVRIADLKQRERGR